MRTVGLVPALAGIVLVVAAVVVARAGRRTPARRGPRLRQPPELPGLAGIQRAAGALRRSGGTPHRPGADPLDTAQNEGRRAQSGKNPAMDGGGIG